MLVELPALVSHGRFAARDQAKSVAIRLLAFAAHGQQRRRDRGHDPTRRIVARQTFCSGAGATRDFTLNGRNGQRWLPQRKPFD